MMSPREFKIVFKRLARQYKKMHEYYFNLIKFYNIIDMKIKDKKKIIKCIHGNYDLLKQIKEKKIVDVKERIEFSKNYDNFMKSFEKNRKEIKRHYNIDISKAEDVEKAKEKIKEDFENKYKEMKNFCWEILEIAYNKTTLKFHRKGKMRKLIVNNKEILEEVEKEDSNLIHKKIIRFRENYEKFMNMFEKKKNRIVKNYPGLASKIFNIDELNKNQTFEMYKKKHFKPFK